MAPFKSSDGRSLGKLLEGFKTSTLGQGFGSAGASSPGVPLLATGGTKTFSNGYFFHYFNSPGPAPFSCNTPIPGASFVLVAGGGSGCGGYGGGGGGGGVVYSNGGYEITSGEWTVNIGNGDGPRGPGRIDGQNGSDSTFSHDTLGTTLTAKGGGGGRGSRTAGNAGGNCGGGGSDATTTPTQPSQNSGVTGITNAGNIGGQGPSGGPGYAHGGGGGAGQAGLNAPDNNVSGPGGVGLGPPTWSWVPTVFFHNGYVAGGGGGSSYSSNGTPGGASPDGTGGRAGNLPNGNGVDGIYGGGGGAGTTPNPGQPYSSYGGAGGNGCMLIAYPQTL